MVLHLGYSYSGNPAPAENFNGAEFIRLVMVRILTKNNPIQLRNIELMDS